MVRALERSLEAHPRRVVVLYVKPVHTGPWESSRWFRAVEEDARIAVYDDARRLEARPVVPPPASRTGEGHPRISP